MIHSEPHGRLRRQLPERGQGLARIAQLTGPLRDERSQVDGERMPGGERGQHRAKMRRPQRPGPLGVEDQGRIGARGPEQDGRREDPRVDSLAAGPGRLAGEVLHLPVHVEGSRSDAGLAGPDQPQPGQLGQRLGTHTRVGHGGRELLREVIVGNRHRRRQQIRHRDLVG